MGGRLRKLGTESSGGGRTHAYCKTKMKNFGNSRVGEDEDK